MTALITEHGSVIVHHAGTDPQRARCGTVLIDPQPTSYDDPVAAGEAGLCVCYGCWPSDKHDTGCLAIYRSPLR